MNQMLEKQANATIKVIHLENSNWPDGQGNRIESPAE